MNGMLDHLCLQGVKMALFAHDAVCLVICFFVALTSMSPIEVI